MKDHRAVRYTYCAISVVLATLAHVVLAPIIGSHVEFITFFMAVVYSSWIAGFGGGLFATVLSAVAAAIYGLGPGERFSFGKVDDVFSILLFVIEGAAIGALGQAQIAARKRAETSTAEAIARAAEVRNSLEIVAASEQRKSAVIRDALDCIIVIDGAGAVTEFNPAAEATFGYSRGEALGRPVAELVIPPALRSAHYEGLARFLSTGEGPVLGRRIELPAMRKGGEEFPVELAIVPTSNADSREFMAYIRDLSERNRAEQEIKQAVFRQWSFVRDVLYSVTQGRLILCGTLGDLPRPLAPTGPVVDLGLQAGTAELRSLAERAGRSIGMSEERIFDLVTACSEAAMNAIVHVGSGVATVYESDDLGRVQVSVIDHGAGIALENLPHATLRKGYTTAGTFGHGMKLMLETADRVFLLTGATGTTVVIEQDRLPAVTRADLADG